MNPQDSQIHFCTVVLSLMLAATVLARRPVGSAVVDVDRPGPGEELNDGAVTVPRQAATVIVLRGGSQTLEILLVQRNPAQRFMGGAWVFPGGAVHADEDADHAATAVRELEEEAGIDLPGPTELVPFSRWITPEAEGATIRFDTWFYAARARRRRGAAGRRRVRRRTLADAG